MKPFAVGSLLVLSGCTVKPDAVQLVQVPVKTVATQPISKLPQTVSPEDICRALARDGKFAATGTLLRTPQLHGSVEVRDAKTKRVLAALPAVSGATGLAFSPDGTMLAVNGPSRLAVWNWKVKKVLHSQNFDTGGGQFRVQSAFSPDGKQLAVAFGELRVLNVATWKAKHFPQVGEPAFVDAATWSPDGRFLALSQHDMVAFSIVELRNGRVRSLGGIDAASEPVFSHDSRYLAGATNEGTFIWKTKNGAKTFVGGNYEHPVLPVAFSPDARLLAVENGQGHIAIRSVATGKQVQVGKSARRAAWLNLKTLPRE